MSNWVAQQKSNALCKCCYNKWTELVSERLAREAFRASSQLQTSGNPVYTFVINAIILKGSSLNKSK